MAEMGRSYGSGIVGVPSARGPARSSLTTTCTASFTDQPTTQASAKEGGLGGSGGGFELRVSQIYVRASGQSRPACTSPQAPARGFVALLTRSSPLVRRRGCCTFLSDNLASPARSSFGSPWPSRPRLRPKRRWLVGRALSRFLKARLYRCRSHKPPTRLAPLDCRCRSVATRPGNLPCLSRRSGACSVGTLSPVA